MSITPRKPPRATYSEAETARRRPAGSARVSHRLWRAARAMAGWVWRRVSRLRGDHGDDADDGTDTGDGRAASSQRGAVARLVGRDERADGPAGLPGSSGPAGPGLPPRPDLEATETEDGLELRQPDRDGAFVTSSKWEEVRP